MSPAALFRLEGALSPCPTLAAAAWLAANAQRVRERAVRLGAAAAALPLSFGPFRDATLANKIAWAGVRGVSEDRLLELGAEYAQRYLIPSVRPEAVRLIDASRASGFRIVLISDNVEAVVRPLADALDVDEVLCNRLELIEREATGRLADPVVGEHIDGGWARAWAEERGIDLGACRAYGAREADSVLLGAVGNPCTIHPDRRLRRIARHLDWPIVES